MFDSKKAMELQKLHGVANFKKLTIPQMLERANLIELLQCSPTDIMGNHGIGALADHLIANDVVPVVRCKDCKHWMHGDSFSGDSLDDMQRIGRCPIVRFGRRENDFCCEGERKDND